MKIVFMGTPEFAAASLEALVEAGHEVLLAVTQPDREKGRGKKVMFSPVKECALKYNIPVFQPVRIKNEDAVAELKKYAADIFVVAAFGQILSSEILEMPEYGCINVHASLLPRYRGAAPIQWSIIDGMTESGVTIMQMNEGLDTGDMISKAVVPILPDETGDSLHDKLMAAGARLLVETLISIENKTAVRTPQNGELSCYARMLTKEMGRLDFSKTAVELDRLIRGLNSWPGTYTMYNGKTLKIWEADIEESAEPGSETPGTISKVTKNDFCVRVADGYLKIKSLQLEGKKRMNASDFMRGNQIAQGDMFLS